MQMNGQVHAPATLLPNPLNRILDGPQSRSRRGVAGNSSYPNRDSNGTFPAHSPVTTPTALAALGIKEQSFRRWQLFTHPRN